MEMSTLRRFATAVGRSKNGDVATQPESHVVVSGADSFHFAWSDARECAENVADERQKIGHPIGPGPSHDHAERKTAEIVLRFQFSVHREECVGLAGRALEQVAILRTGPPEPLHGQ